MIAISSLLGVIGTLECIALIGVIGLVIHAENQLRRSIAVLDFVLALDMCKSLIKQKSKEHVRAAIEGEVMFDDEGRKTTVSNGEGDGDGDRPSGTL